MADDDGPPLSSGFDQGMVDHRPAVAVADKQIVLAVPFELPNFLEEFPAGGAPSEFAVGAVTPVEGLYPRARLIEVEP